MPLPTQQNPKGPKNWGKFSKTLSFWVLITLLAGTLFTYTSGSRDAATKMEYWQVWLLRDGKALRWEEYLDRAEALEAVGLPE